MVVVCMFIDFYMIMWLGVWIIGCVLFFFRFIKFRFCFWIEGFFIVEFFNFVSLFINLLVRYFLFVYEWENGDRNRCMVC